MSTNTQVLTEEDPAVLHAKLEQLWSETENAKFTAPPGLSEEQLSEARARFEQEQAEKMREQIAILAKLRRVSTGPPKKSKRTKSAPIDLDALMNAVE